MASTRDMDPRERLVSTAYDLFSQYGVRAVGIDRVIDEAGVAKSTLYRHFPSKNDLIVAALVRRQELWTRGWLQSEVEHLGGSPGAQLLYIFDVLDGWFRRRDFEGCMFLATLLESHDRSSPAGEEAVRQLAYIRSYVADLARQAGVEDPEAFALGWQILMSGSILGANQGRVEAAGRARQLGRTILEQEGIDTGE
jgi:AcrR family transcriptional regulator